MSFLGAKTNSLNNTWWLKRRKLQFQQQYGQFLLLVALSCLSYFLSQEPIASCLTVLTSLRHLVNHDLSFLLHRTSEDKAVLCAHPGLKIFQWLHYSEASEVYLISTVMEFLGVNSLCLNTQIMLSHYLDPSFGWKRLAINMRGTSKPPWRR